MVFWSFPEIERDSVLSLLRKVESERYSEVTIDEEAEMMAYTVADRDDGAASRLHSGEIKLASKGSGKKLRE